MNGPAIYRRAFRHVETLLEALLTDAGMTTSEIDWVIPHQASGPALAALERLGFEASRVVNIVGEYGNCIAASIPMALAYADAAGQLTRGQKLLFLGTGAGLSVGGAVVTW
jgi:3-oxoacyl-[acyl-carrier-protein] synthase-3